MLVIHRCYFLIEFNKRGLNNWYIEVPRESLCSVILPCGQFHDILMVMFHDLLLHLILVGSCLWRWGGSWEREVMGGYVGVFDKCGGGGVVFVWDL